ncbi:MAG: DUF2868 domain-containing protein [Desulforhopalus sp.]|nr:DUF2868 domain-containing protein [Desulforhopalus sp.]
MKTTWNYQDIINLEYFFHRDKDGEETDLHRRDRQIFLDHQQQTAAKERLSRREILRLWLHARIAEEFPGPERKSPGALLGDTLRLAKGLAIVLGILLGAGTGLTFFTYTGTTPVNVFHFLLFFVLSQLLLAGLVFATCLLRLLVPAMSPPSFYSLLFKRAVGRLAGVLHRSWLQGLDADKRTSIVYALDTFRTGNAVYGALFYWPLFGLVQLFAIFCNIGLLAATMLKIATSDLAFGWQSTLQISSDMLHRGVQLAALPWSWFVPKSSSYPSLAEIEGSRIILKDGLHHLATGDLVAWWPFLVLCLVFYGLLLRLAFAVLGRLLEEHALARLDLGTASCLNPIRRMRTPLVTTQAAPEPDRPAAQATGGGRDQAPEQGLQLLPQIVLVPDDIFGLCPTDKLTPLLQERGFAIVSVQKFMTGYDEDEELKDNLALQCRNPQVGLFILMEGWMPPLVAFLTYLRELREVLPEKTMIHLGLVGRPVLLGFAPLAPQDLAIWRKKLAAARDPYLQILSLLP